MVCLFPFILLAGSEVDDDDDEEDEVDEDVSLSAVYNDNLG